MSIREEICKFVFDLPIVDTHAHLRDPATLPQPMSALALFNASGNMRQLWASSGALSRQDYRQLEEFRNWDEFSAALSSVKATAFYRIFLNGIKEIYDLSSDELDRSTFEELSEKLSRAYEEPDWYVKVIRDRAGICATCQDSRRYVDRSFLTPVARFDQYVWFGRPEWRAKVVEKHGYEKLTSLDGLLECLEQDFDQAIRAGAAAVKNNSTWCRRIDFSDSSRSDAVSAFADSISSKEYDPRATKCLGDYVMNRICELCAHYDVPLQLHTGPAGGLDHMVDWGNPCHLNELMIRHPKTKFVLFHAGGPFANECRDLAVQIPNCYLDLCGVMAVRGLKAILDDWIERVPHTKLMWGTDANLAEDAFALAANFRTVLVDLLEERVNSRYFSLETALEVSQALLSGNAKRILKIDLKEPQSSNREGDKDA